MDNVYSADTYECALSQEGVEVSAGTGVGLATAKHIVNRHGGLEAQRRRELLAIFTLPDAEIRKLWRWTGGMIRATVHRVLGSGEERFSIPFFYEARVDAVIAPLPLAAAAPFEPFSYGDHLWEATTQFVEQKGIKHSRRPRGTDGRAA